jgi:hypothetical protein
MSAGLGSGFSLTPSLGVRAALPSGWHHQTEVKLKLDPKDAA